MEIVDDYSKIILDVAICGYMAQPNPTIEKSAIHNFQAAKSIKDYYAGSNSLFEQAEAYPGLEMRYYF